MKYTADLHLNAQFVFGRSRVLGAMTISLATLAGVCGESVSLAQAAAPIPAAVPAPAPLPVASLPTALKTAASLTPENQATIEAFITAQAQLLGAPAAESQTAGREALVSAVRVDGVASKSSSDYLSAYVPQLNKAIAPLSTNPNLRVRLNVAIIAARVATDAPAQSQYLASTIEGLLKSENDPAVLIWVFKSLQPLVPASMVNPNAQFPNANPLVDAIVAKSLKYPSGPVIEEAYAALTLGWQGSRGRQLTPAMYKTVIPAVQKVLAERIASYKAGVPEEPILDANYGLRFLLDSAVLPLQTPAQKLQTAQLLHDLTTVAAARAANATAGRGTKEDLIPLLQRISSALQVIAGYEKADAATIGAMRSLATITTTTTGPIILDASRTAISALKKIPAFAELKPTP